jgi:hypothetical protein
MGHDSSSDVVIFHENILKACESLQALLQYPSANSNAIRQDMIRVGVIRAMSLGHGNELQEDVMRLFTTTPGGNIDEDCLQWLQATLECSMGRDLVAISICPPHGSTDQIDFGMINPHPRIGDSIYVLDGCEAPVVLRTADEGLEYTLVGDAYMRSLEDLYSDSHSVEDYYLGNVDEMAAYMENIVII